MGEEKAIKCRSETSCVESAYCFDELAARQQFPVGRVPVVLLVRRRKSLEPKKRPVIVITPAYAM